MEPQDTILKKVSISALSMKEMIYKQGHKVMKT